MGRPDVNHNAASWNPPNIYPNGPRPTNPDGTPIPCQYTPSPPPAATPRGSVLLIDFVGTDYSASAKPPGSWGPVGPL